MTMQSHRLPFSICCMGGHLDLPFHSAAQPMHATTLLYSLKPSLLLISTLAIFWAEEKPYSLWMRGRCSSRMDL